MSGRQPRRRGGVLENVLGGAVTFLFEIAIVVVLAVVALTLSTIILAVT